MVQIGKIFSKPSFAWVPQGSKTFTVPSPLPVTTKITLVKFMTESWAFQKFLGSFKVKNHRNKAKKGQSSDFIQIMAENDASDLKD